MAMSEQVINDIYSNLPDNSHVNRDKINNRSSASSDENSRKEKVVTGKVKVRSNPKRKLTDIFISEDVVNVKNYILLDVIVPSLKKAIYDLIVGTLDISLYGGKNGGKRPTADKISYRDYSSISQRDYRSTTSGRSTYSYDDIIIPTRGEAEAVLSRMDDIMEEYGVVKVADMYDLVGITGDYTDNKYGWTNIRNAKIVKVYDGYTIEMPRAMPIR